MASVIAVLVSATFAWLIGTLPPTLRNPLINTDDKGDLYVWVKVEEDIENEDMDNILAIIHNNFYGEDDTGNDGTGMIASAGEIPGMYSAASAGEIADVYNIASDGEISGNLPYSEYVLPDDEELREQKFLPLKKVGTDESIKYTIDMNMVEQDNIQKNTLAPGAYGKAEFKILSMTSLTKGYTLTVTPELMGISDGFKNNGAGLTDEDLFGLVKSHIKFYAVNEAGTYSQVIPYYDGDAQNIDLHSLSGDLDKGIIKDIVLYWYWPYEFTDIPEQDFNNSNSPVYEDYAKYRDDTKSAEELIEIYDWDDTYIGNYVEGLRFRFEVKGNRD